MASRGAKGLGGALAWGLYCRPLSPQSTRLLRLAVLITITKQVLTEHQLYARLRWAQVRRRGVACKPSFSAFPWLRGGGQDRG